MACQLAVCTERCSALVSIEYKRPLLFSAAHGTKFYVVKDDKGFGAETKKILH